MLVPNAQQRLRAGNLEIVTAYLMPQNVELIKAVRKRHQAELDFRTEAANLRECSKNMRRRGFEPRLVRLPRVVDVSRHDVAGILGCILLKVASGIVADRTASARGTSCKPHDLC